MRVLQVVHDFLPRAIAGVEIYTLELSLELARRGHEVTVLHATRGPGQTQYSLLDGVVHGLPVVRMVQNYPYRPLDEVALDPQAERRFCEVMDRVEPDVVHIQHLWGWSAALPALVRERGAAVIVHLHDHWLVCPSGGQRVHAREQVCEDLGAVDCDACYARFRSQEGPLERLALRAARRVPPPLPPDLLHRTFAALPPRARELVKRINERRGPRADDAPRLGAVERRQVYREALEAADLLVSPSRDLAERMGVEGYGAIRHVPNGTAVPPAAAPLPGLADPEAPLTLLFLGTPLRHKGVHVLAEAAAAAGASTRLVVHGADPGADLSEQLRRAGVEAAGPLERAAVPGAIDAADLVCLPSLWPENAPLVLLEARSRRRPVLASDIGGIPETAQGRLLPPGDVDAWANALREIASDRGTLHDLAAAVSPPRTVADNADAVLELYEGVAR